MKDERKKRIDEALAPLLELDEEIDLSYENLIYIFSRLTGEEDSKWTNLFREFIDTHTRTDPSLHEISMRMLHR